jgi:hypothetical protein
MYRHVYEWDPGPIRWTDKFKADRPVPERTILFDLLRGDMLFVEEISSAGSPDMPRPVMRTRPVGTLTQDKLSKLRKRANYAPTDYSLPLEEVVFFTDPAELREFLQ